ncbi:AtpZ/AtpI family protein [candidate division FCPU426 bacterium]|nr:AtpZ/AtpI family protein [candidate division FCPU426 bacterium]
MPAANHHKYHQMGQASMAGIMLVACIFIGLAIGVWLDRWLGLRPWLTLFFLIMGIIAGFYNVARIVAALGKKERTK